MTPQKTNKALCFNPGDYGVYSNAWFQRQSSGELTAIFPSGDFLFIKINQEMSVKLKVKKIKSKDGIKLIFASKVDVDHVGLGNIISVLPYFNENLPRLFRKRPGLLRPDLLHYGQDSTYLRSLPSPFSSGLGVMITGDVMQISASNTVDSRYSSIWQNNAPLPEIQSQYVSWLISNLVNNRLPINYLDWSSLSEFSICAIKYLRPEINKELAQLLKREESKKRSTFTKVKLNRTSVKLWVNNLADLARNNRVQNVKKTSDALVGPLVGL